MATRESLVTSTPVPLAHLARRADEAFAAWRLACEAPLPDAPDESGRDLTPANRAHEGELSALHDAILAARVALLDGILAATGFRPESLAGADHERTHRPVATVREGDKLFCVVIVDVGAAYQCCPLVVDPGP